MCPNSTNCREKYTQQTVSEEVQIVDNVLTNSTATLEVFLETLVVKLKTETKSIMAREIIDTGSQKSYILEDTVNKLQCECLGKEKVTHSLFDGVETAQQEHKRYKIILSSLNDEYICVFKH